jgi:membrane fusion protein (multidrug efflux system)
MKKFAAILVLLCLTVLSSGCSREGNTATVRNPPTVVVTPAQRGEITRSLTLPGDLAGYYQSTLYAKVTGYLKTISVDKGDWVKAGQVLAEIEVPELKERLERARADLQIQKVTYDRLQQVWKKDPRLVARQDVDVASGKYREAKAQVDELTSVAGYTRIVAPFAGVITGRFVDPGALIRAGGGASEESADASASGGQANAILSEAMIDKVRVYLYVPEGAVGQIRRGMPAKLSVQDFPGRMFDGAVTRFSTSLDLSTRTMLTEVDLDNPKHELYPGMYANVNLELERHPDAIYIPDAAVGTEPEGSFLYVVRQGALSKVSVVTGIRNGRFVEITRGLKDGEQVVAALDPGLNDGEAVKVIREQPAHTSQDAVAQNPSSEN